MSHPRFSYVASREHLFVLQPAYARSLWLASTWLALGGSASSRGVPAFVYSSGPAPPPEGKHTNASETSRLTVVGWAEGDAPALHCGLWACRQIRVPPRARKAGALQLATLLLHVSARVPRSTQCARRVCLGICSRRVILFRNIGTAQRQRQTPERWGLGLRLLVRDSRLTFA